MSIGRCLSEWYSLSKKERLSLCKIILQLGFFAGMIATPFLSSGEDYRGCREGLSICRNKNSLPINPYDSAAFTAFVVCMLMLPSAINIFMISTAAKKMGFLGIRGLIKKPPEFIKVAIPVVSTILVTLSQIITLGVQPMHLSNSKNQYHINFDRCAKAINCTNPCPNLMDSSPDKVIYLGSVIVTCFLAFVMQQIYSNYKEGLKEKSQQVKTWTKQGAATAAKTIENKSMVIELSKLSEKPSTINGSTGATDPVLYVARF